MSEALADRVATDVDGGFTLIELMVVLLIMAILLAIAIPTFLGVKNGASDRSAQANLESAIQTVKGFYANNGGIYASATQATLDQADPTFDFQLTTGSGTVYCNSTSPANCIAFSPVDVASVGDNQGMIFADYSPDTRTCWFVAVIETGVALVQGDSEPPFGFARYGPPLNNSDPQLGSAASSTTILTAGTYYAEKTPIDTHACSAYTAAVAAPFYWGTSFGTAGVN